MSQIRAEITDASGYVAQKPLVTMIDYGIGNLRSVQKAVERVGGEVALTADPARVRAAEKLILPGVGAFGAGMEALEARGLVEPMREAVAAGIPLLGICLGMQLLFEESEEMGQHRGLGLLPGRVLRFRGDGLKVPHMGWNRIERKRAHPLLGGVADGAHGYFVHSYYCEPEDAAAVIASSDYGGPFAAIAGKGQVVGIQFHPEKSQQVGLRILRNYVQWAREAG